MTEILEQLIKKAVQALREEGAREVFIFGSAADVSADHVSDIDLAVKGLPPKRFIKAMGKVGDILQCPFDLVDLDEENPFTRYLREEGELRRVG